MHIVAAVLSVVLAAPAMNGPEREVAAFVADLQAGREAEAYARMSPAAKQVMGPAQLAAYAASRRRALGAIAGVTNIRRSKEDTYEADVRFEKGTAPSWFVLLPENGQWRVVRFGMEMPAGTAASYDAAELMPVVHEILGAMKSGGAPAIAGRFSAKDLAEVNQTPAAVANMMDMTHALLGRLTSYELGQPETDGDAKCGTVKGKGTFEHGVAPLTLRLCWNDGVWRLRHANIDPQLTPSMLERSLEYSLKGEVDATCPRGAAFPVGGQIVCRVTPRGEAAQDVTILRTTDSGWRIVGLAPVR